MIVTTNRRPEISEFEKERLEKHRYFGHRHVVLVRTPYIGSLQFVAVINTTTKAVSEYLISLN